VSVCVNIYRCFVGRDQGVANRDCIHEPTVASVSRAPSSAPSVRAWDRREPQATDCENRLEQLEVRLDGLRPAKERFALAARSVESEERLRPVLSRMLVLEQGIDPTYQLECHADVCRLRVPDDKAVRDNWSDVIQSDRVAREMFRRVSFDSGEVYITLDEPGAVVGRHFVNDVEMSFYESSTLAECKNRNRDPGNVTIHIVFDAPSRKASTIEDGTLANQALGICIHHAMEDLLRVTRVPQEMVSVPDWPMFIDSP
jgi:hypothetical protein